MSGQILDRMMSSRSEQVYWPSTTFKTFFRDRFNCHEFTFDQTMQYMLDEHLLCQENVGGSWYIWYVDGLLAEDPVEQDTYNERIRNQIREDNKLPKSVLAEAIYRFVDAQFPVELPYTDLHDEFLDCSEKQIQRAVKILIEEKRIERSRKHNIYFLSSI